MSSPEHESSLPLEASILAAMARFANMSLVAVDRNARIMQVVGQINHDVEQGEKLSKGMLIDDFFAHDPDHAKLYHDALDNQPSRMTVPSIHGGFYEIQIVPLVDAHGAVQGAMGFAHDVTDRETASRIQRERETEVERLFQNSQDGIFLLNRNFEIQRASATALSIYAPDGPLVGQVCHQRVFGKDTPCAHCPVVETFRTGQSAQAYSYDTDLRKHLQLNAAPLFDPQSGELIGALETFRDITEQVESEANAKSKETLVDDIFSSIHDGLFIMGPDFTITRANPTFEAMNATHMPVVGKKCFTTAGFDQKCANCPAVITFETGTLATLTHKAQPNKDAPEIWVDHSSHPIFSSDGKVAAVICSIRDITKRKEDEAALERYRDKLEVMVEERTRELRETRLALEEVSERTQIMLDSAPFACNFWSDDFDCIDCNLAAAKLMGFDDKKEFLKHFYELSPEYQPDGQLSREAARTNLMKAFETGYHCFEWVQIDREGRSIPVEITLVRAERGSRHIVVGYARDLRELKKKEEERKRYAENLEIARNEAESANKAKSEFLAHMSHEIRTPLNGVIGLSDLLLGTELNAKQHEYARLVNDSGTSLLFLINDILDFSKIEAGKLDVDSEPFDLPANVESVLGILGSRAAGKGLELGVSFCRNLPRIVQGDSGRIRQILLNLVGNAVKFTERGGVRIGVVIDALGDDNITIRFSVKDTGIGIAKDRMDRLFKAFSQTDASSARIYGGTGLGLAISMKLVHLMGGEIGVESEEGHGSTFWFSVPFTCDPTVVACIRNDLERHAKAKHENCPHADGDFCAAISHKEIGRAFEVKGRRVLIVDDSDIQRETLQTQLANWQMRCETCDRGTEAMRLLTEAAKSSDPFELLVVDNTLADGDGFSLCRQLVAWEEKESVEIPPMVLLRSLAEEIDPDFLHQSGTETISKPVYTSALFDAVMNQLFDADTRKKIDSGIYNPNAPDARKPVRHSKRPKPVQLGPTYRRSVFAGKIRVLIVEDNRVNQIVAKNLLAESGFDSDIANNGCEACDAVRKNSYDIVLMDCQMPDMDGYEATDLIRKWEREQGKKRIPIIALTANATKEDVQKCLDAGMDAYSSKPINPQAILRLIEDWYERSNERT